MKSGELEQVALARHQLSAGVHRLAHDCERLLADLHRPTHHAWREHAGHALVQARYLVTLLARSDRVTDARALEESVRRWNRSCDAGKDTDFGRTKMLVPIAQPPYYAIALSPSMLNTQGGPRRNEHAQVVRPDSTPIPRLYSAGELGSIYSYLYQGTGNIGECLAFGRIAARNAVAHAPWDAQVR